MSTNRSRTQSPIPASTAKDRGCSSLWGIVPVGDATAETRGPLLRAIREAACGSKIACSAWKDAFADPEDQPLAVYGTVDSSLVSNSDMPFNHSSHDWVFNVDLDDEYIQYHSDANKTNADGRMLLHCEWELPALRNAFGHLPSAGDRIWIIGRWVFDCAHPEHCKTEIHPPEALASWRRTPIVDDETGDCIDGVRVKAIVSGNGGACYSTSTVKKPLTFDLPLPQPPAPDAALVVQTAANGDEPHVLTHVDGETPHVEIRLPFAPGDELPWEAYVATVELGWRQANAQRECRRATVSLDAVTVHQTHDFPQKNDGEWNLWVCVNGNWVQALDRQRVERGQQIALVNLAVDLVLTESLTPEEPVLRLDSSGWEGDAIDSICDFEEERTTRRGFPDLPDLPDLPGLPSREKIFAWMLEQAGKIQNERLGVVTASHRWHDLSEGRHSADSDFPGGADYTLHYSIRFA